MSEHIYSVSQLNQSVRLMLENQLGYIWLTGEISNFTQPVSGHWYLTLKDENAQVRCAMFRQKNLRVSFRPQNGMQVLVRASVSLYEPRGDYQIIIESMTLAGEGLLQQRFDGLKMKLAAEGLFAQHLKKQLPHFCRAVGVITSKIGAALQDILHILQRRDPSLKVVIYPTAVQGKEATSEIVNMIELANKRKEVDVLIVGRGGGSIEDLWCFNEEIVARAIFHSQLPIISAVGHETDVTIADFVADLRAPTPSAAAELVSRNQEELLAHFQYYQERLEMALDRVFQAKQQQLQQLKFALQQLHPQAKLQHQKYKLLQLKQSLQFATKHYLQNHQYQLQTLHKGLLASNLGFQVEKHQQYIQQIEQRLIRAIQYQFKLKQNQLAKACGHLDSLSPLNVLARGYSMTADHNGVMLTDMRQVKVGDEITTTLAQGKIISKVSDILD